MVMAEVKFRDVAMQMFFSAVLINCAHALFEDREIAFDRVGRSNISPGLASMMNLWR